MVNIADRTHNKIVSRKSDTPIRPKITADSVREQLQMIPERTVNAFKNLRSVKKEFALPITMSGVSKEEYKEIEDFLYSLELDNGYIQELGEHEEEYVPEWNINF